MSPLPTAITIVRIYPNVAGNSEVHAPDQLWVVDITYVAIATDFVYLAAGVARHGQSNRPGVILLFC